MTDTLRPPEDSSPETPRSSSDINSNAKEFAQLVKNMLQEHEEKELLQLQRLTSMMDLLVNDARGLHLQIASQGTQVAQLERDVGQLNSRIGKLEQDIIDLMQKKMADPST